MKRGIEGQPTGEDDPSLRIRDPAGTTDNQEAKTIVEVLSSAQVLAMFEALSAKKSWSEEPRQPSRGSLFPSLRQDTLLLRWA